MNRSHPPADDRHGAWHADAELVRRYAEGSLPTAAAASVEAHVVSCDRCQELFATAAVAAPDRLDAVWHDIVDIVDQPRRGVAERALVGAGVAPHTARLLTATVSLRGSWLAGVAATLAFAVASAGTGDGGGLAMLLVLAPLVPVAGTAAAFGSWLDPARELAVAAPLHGFRLLLIRAVAVVASSLVLGLALSVAVDGGWEVAAWVAPALALTTVTLLLSTWVAPTAAALSTSAAWIAIVAIGAAPLGRGGRWLAALRAEALIDSVTFQPAGQLSLIAVAGLAALLVVQRRDTFDHRSPT